MTREKYTTKNINSNTTIVENQIVSFDKVNGEQYSYRVHKDGFVGIFYHQGKDIGEEGFAKAEEKLELKRPYPFELEVGKRSRDKTEKPLSDEEIMDTSRKILKYLHKKYPDYTFGGSVNSSWWEDKIENSLGMEYSCKDANSSINIEFKHKDSKDISDGYISFTQRTIKLRQFYKIADNILENFTKEVPMPEECIIIDKYYDYTSLLRSSLSLEKLKSGTSLLSGKVGQKVFSEDLTVFHDVSDKNTWMASFWDGDGVVPKGDKVFFIKNSLYEYYPNNNLIKYIVLQKDNFLLKMERF